MSEPARFCKYCGTQISADAQFCKSCGKPVQALAAPTAPVTARPSQSTWFIAGCATAIVLIICAVAIIAGGFFFLQNTQARVTPTSFAVLPPSTPLLAPTSVSLPTLPVPTIAPTSAPLPTLSLPTIAPTLAASPALTPKCLPTPALPTGVLFNDDFASRQVSECNGWGFQSGEATDYTWAANQLTISLRRQQWLGMSWPYGEFADFGVETQAQPISSNYAEYGLVLRLSGAANARGYYIFGLRTDGKYYLQKKVAGQWVTPDPVSPTASSAIKLGGAPNIIGVIAQGSTLSLYINRVLVKTLTDTSITNKGSVGIFAGTGDNDTTAVKFSRFTILTPDKAKAEWGSASGSTQPSTSNIFTVFFTIQNGSPTGYVIDKSGVKHTPPGYLTISDLHVAPGDRIVIQTDQPRFSLLFDCGTTPQTFTPCDFVATTPAGLPTEIRKNINGTAYLNISRADNWAGTRANFPSQRYPADPVLRIGFGN